MRVFKLFIILLIIGSSSCVQRQTTINRPKIVIGLVVDQMRWDYLYRYYDRYGNGGFKRLLKDGYNCQNANIDYLPSFTGPGHACIYTGSVPSIHGIAGNNWIDNQTGRNWYCVDDDKVSLAGDKSKTASYSPHNMLTTTITDELRLATNFRSRVFGIAIKDRGAILPAGHTGNAAYWYNDKTGDFVTSTYYDTAYQNPAWLQAFNKQELADKLAKQNWLLLYVDSTYKQSVKDQNDYEDPFKGENNPVFPHKFNELARADRISAIKSTPAGNTLTLNMARACIEGEKLGKNMNADFLCVSLSSTDYAGHQFAPNAVELEDMYLRLDKEIDSFLCFLDKSFGRSNYLFFLTADHGGAHNPKFLNDHKIPAGIAFNLTADLNSYLRDQFKKDSLVRGIVNYQVFLNEEAIAGNKSLNRDAIKTGIRNWILDKMTATYRIPVSYVIDMEDVNRYTVPEPIRTMAINGYNHQRSGCLQIILNPGWFESDRFTGTTHGSWNPYDSHIPLIWYGWHIPKGETNKPCNMTDISATLAALLHIQAPNGCIGKPIIEITDKVTQAMESR
jgi:predicted AlkP superfamily pyrophosphatase or phosphodiesterase